MSRAIETLLTIMGSADAAPKRRVEAAEHIISYEASNEIIEKVKGFLTSVFDDEEVGIDTRLDALKLMRKAEAARITRPAVSVADDRANREAWRQVEIANRRMAMIDAGLWPPPKGWMDDLRRENYVASPEGSAVDYIGRLFLGPNCAKSR